MLMEPFMVCPTMLFGEPFQQQKILELVSCNMTYIWQPTLHFRLVIKDKEEKTIATLISCQVTTAC